ncbi:uncharacterized protein BXZ73DRAFT_77089 [Epithele typhae]|uniref:uncharacterized protein n=1 Tax=Epithele typhae TaxID=378194 RepID=UPI002008D51F|nr:uncharacterized protein BXZ73DRAFT_77089 [Epithele typhae]KAH9933977.1 hypothetical protein BXZ73DRAFT_77089 [Epithele typhae]
MIGRITRSMTRGTTAAPAPRVAAAAAPIPTLTTAPTKKVKANVASRAAKKFVETAKKVATSRKVARADHPQAEAGPSSAIAGTTTADDPQPPVAPKATRARKASQPKPKADAQKSAASEQAKTAAPAAELEAPAAPAAGAARKRKTSVVEKDDVETQSVPEPAEAKKRKRTTSTGSTKSTQVTKAAKNSPPLADPFILHLPSTSPNPRLPPFPEAPAYQSHLPWAGRPERPSLATVNLPVPPAPAPIPAPTSTPTRPRARKTLADYEALQQSVNALTAAGGLADPEIIRQFENLDEPYILLNGDLENNNKKALVSVLDKSLNPLWPAIAWVRRDMDFYLADVREEHHKARQAAGRPESNSHKDIELGESSDEDDWKDEEERLTSLIHMHQQEDTGPDYGPIVQPSEDEIRRDQPQLAARLLAKQEIERRRASQGLARDADKADGRGKPRKSKSKGRSKGRQSGSSPDTLEALKNQYRGSAIRFFAANDNEIEQVAIEPRSERAYRYFKRPEGRANVAGVRGTRVQNIYGAAYFRTHAVRAPPTLGWSYQGVTTRVLVAPPFPLPPLEETPPPEDPEPSLPDGSTPARRQGLQRWGAFYDEKSNQPAALPEPSTPTSPTSATSAPTTPPQQGGEETPAPKTRRRGQPLQRYNAVIITHRPALDSPSVLPTLDSPSALPALESSPSALTTLDTPGTGSGAGTARPFSPTEFARLLGVEPEPEPAVPSPSHSPTDPPRAPSPALTSTPPPPRPALQRNYSMNNVTSPTPPGPVEQDPYQTSREYFRERYPSPGLAFDFGALDPEAELGADERTPLASPTLESDFDFTFSAATPPQPRVHPLTGETVVRRGDWADAEAAEDARRRARWAAQAQAQAEAAAQREEAVQKRKMEEAARRAKKQTKGLKLERSESQPGLSALFGAKKRGRTPAASGSRSGAPSLLAGSSAASEHKTKTPHRTSSLGSNAQAGPSTAGRTQTKTQKLRIEPTLPATPTHSDVFVTIPQPAPTRSLEWLSPIAASSTPKGSGKGKAPAVLVPATPQRARVDEGEDSLERSAAARVAGSDDTDADLEEVEKSLELAAPPSPFKSDPASAGVPEAKRVPTAKRGRDEFEEDLPVVDAHDKDLRPTKKLRREL